MEGGKADPSCSAAHRDQPGVRGCQIAISSLGLPKGTMLCLLLPAMLPLSSALQHDVGLLYQFSGVRTPTLGVMQVCRCMQNVLLFVIYR